MLLKIGAEKAIDEGFIHIREYGKIKSNIDLFKNCTAEPKALDKLDNIWIYGRPGTGKTRYALKCFEKEGYYEKDKSKYWNGYTD